jgi:hypothetical protein
LRPALLTLWCSEDQGTPPLPEIVQSLHSIEVTFGLPLQSTDYKGCSSKVLH